MAVYDPFCDLSAKLVAVDKDDADLGVLVKYAKAIGATIYRGADNKVFWTHPVVNNVPQTPSIGGETINESASRVMGALRAVTASQRKRTRIRRKIENPDATIVGVLNQTPPLDVNDIYGSVTHFLDNAAAIGDVVRYTTGFKTLNSLGGAKFMVPLEAALARIGPEGNELAGHFRNANQLQHLLEGRALNIIDDVRKTLLPEEIEGGLWAYTEKGIVTNEARRPVLEAARLRLKQLKDEEYDTLMRLGGEVKPKITVSEQVPTGNYWPHHHDVATLRDKRVTRELIDQVIEAHDARGVKIGRDEALNVIADAGLATDREMAVQRLMKNSRKHSETGLSHADAEHILDKYIVSNNRLAGNVEKTRLGIDGYSTDMLTAYISSAKKNSRRIAELATFGPHDKKINDLLERIRHIDGTAYNTAKKAYHLEIGKEGAHLSGIKRELSNWQAAKLSTAVIANTGQSANTIMRVGLQPFAQAAAEILRLKSREGKLQLGIRRYVTENGAMPKYVFQTDDPHQLMSNALGWMEKDGMAGQLDVYQPRSQVSKGLTKGIRGITSFSLVLFEQVEILNRALASRAGEIYFDRLATSIKANPTGKVLTDLTNRAKELGFKYDYLADKIKLGDSQSLSEMRSIAGVRISDQTQFRGGIQALPLYASDSEIGKFMFQFKNFAFSQARFLSRELVGPHGDNARRKRALAGILVAYPALGIGISKGRSFLMGETELSENIDQWMEEAWEDPISMSTLALGTAGFVQAGSLGIVSDIAWSATSGNRFNLSNSFMPPVASTFINAADAIGSSVRMGAGAATGEDIGGDFAQMMTAVSRELGGAGSISRNVVEQSEGDTLEKLYKKVVGR
jgi:hypothetical protein